MSTFDGGNFYYSGQGVVMVGDRDLNGRPKGFIPVGNVSDLKLALATTVLEHHESQTGNRATDVRLITELKSSLSMTMENWSSSALANALSGSVTYRAGAAVTGETVYGYLGKVNGLLYIQVSAVAVKRGAQALTLYTNDSTAWDYRLNAAAGSFQLNPGTGSGNGALTDKLTMGGTAPSAISVGSTTSITVANTAAVGDYATFTGFSGADAGMVNGRVARIVTASPTVVTINIDTSGKTITLGSPLSYFDGTALSVDYTYAAQNQVDAMTNLQTEKYMRFEGLNTVDGGNPVIVEVFRYITDPLKELALISDAFGPFVLDGNCLADTTRLSGSKFFKVTHLR